MLLWKIFENCFAIEHIETVTCPYPQIAIAVSAKVLDVIIRKPVRCIELVEMNIGKPVGRLAIQRQAGGCQ